MALEKYLAIAGLALSVFFVAEIITLFNFMINPEENDSFGFEAAPKIFQFISLSIAPATIMIGASFILSKRYGSKLNGMLIIISGIIVLIGMIFAYTMIDDLKAELVDFTVEITPLLFMGVSIPIMIVGARLLKTRPRKPKKDYLDDSNY
tara:strand:- start:69 stop:518 length:450 start_codon:yes stop_codon:yes gene_type:complete